MSVASSGAAPIRGGTCKNRRLCIGRHCDRRKSEIRDSLARCVTIAPPTIASLQSQGVDGARRFVYSTCGPPHVDVSPDWREYLSVASAVVAVKLSDRAAKFAI
jgi:hypothetical protein